MQGEGFIIVFRGIVAAITGAILAVEYSYKKLLAPAVTFIGRSVREAWTARRAQGWSIGAGRVEWVYVEEDSFAWMADLYYSYQVAGVFYSGHKRVQFGRARDLQIYLDRSPSGAHVYVRHQSTRPQVSVMLNDDRICTVEYMPSYSGPQSECSVGAHEDDLTVGREGTPDA